MVETLVPIHGLEMLVKSDDFLGSSNKGILFKRSRANSQIELELSFFSNIRGVYRSQYRINLLKESRENKLSFTSVPSKNDRSSKTFFVEKYIINHKRKNKVKEFQRLGQYDKIHSMLDLWYRCIKKDSVKDSCELMQDNEGNILFDEDANPIYKTFLGKDIEFVKRPLSDIWQTVKRDSFKNFEDAVEKLYSYFDTLLPVLDACNSYYGISAKNLFYNVLER